MRCININRGWRFGRGLIDNNRRLTGELEERVVDLPHDYMIESDVYAEAPSGPASGYFNAGVAHYWRQLDIPAEWAGERIALRLDGAMMNATVEVNGAKAALHHYGYSPFEVDITRLVYPGEANTVVITVNPSMQPNSRWYSGAGLFRGVALVHMPKLHIAFGGLSGYAQKIEYAPRHEACSGAYQAPHGGRLRHEVSPLGPPLQGRREASPLGDGVAQTAFLKVSAEIGNEWAESRLAEVTFELIDDATGEAVHSAGTLTQVPPLGASTAYMTLTVDAPKLWSAEEPNLYRLSARVKDAGTYRTRIIPTDSPTVDEEDVLFGIRTVEADVKHGLRINGRTVKLKGGCLHHDNGVIGAVSLYDAEAWKVGKLKALGFNAIRTTHNPPSAALIEVCDRLGLYVFDEAFDAWGMGKQPGDYNQYFESDWQADLAAFVRRDRCHPSVILWSTGNEITERAGLNDGYLWATRLAEAVRALDPSRPVSNGICSFWNGLDDVLMADQLRKWRGEGSLQNADAGGPEDLQWERYTKAFANGLDVVGYNYLEDRYAQDHGLFPERVMLGSENYPVQVGVHWPMIERTPWVIGEFTWTAWDYIGEAGIGRATFYDPEDPAMKDGASPWIIGAPFPWRLANDADFDITGAVRPQGVYRRIVWGSAETAVFSYDPHDYGKVEVLSGWGFPGVWDSWTWRGQEGQGVDVLVFSGAEAVELLVNGESAGRVRAGEAQVHGMPKSFLFHTTYAPGTLEAVSYTGGREVSRAKLEMADAPVKVRLVPETVAMRGDGESLGYVRIELVDSKGRRVPDARVALKAGVTGAARLLGMGSGNPITDDNYARGECASHCGAALAVLRSGYQSGTARLKVTAEGVGEATLELPVV